MGYVFSEPLRVTLAYLNILKRPFSAPARFPARPTALPVRLLWWTSNRAANALENPKFQGQDSGGRVVFRCKHFRATGEMT